MIIDHPNSVSRWMSAMCFGFHGAAHTLAYPADLAAQLVMPHLNTPPAKKYATTSRPLRSAFFDSNELDRFNRRIAQGATTEPAKPAKVKAKSKLRRVWGRTPTLH